MKTKTLLVAALAVFVLASCAGDQQSSGIALENMDKSYAPGDNFYEFVNGNWVKSHPVPAEYSRYGVFEVLGEKVKDQIDLLIEEVTSTSHEQGTIEQKISDLYLMVMDSTARNQAGLAPIEPYLARINNVTNKQELVTLMAEYGVKGISGLFRINLGTDRMDSKSYLVNASASGMSLRQKENYTDNDANTVAIREAFTKHMQNMFVMAGNDAKKAAEKVAAIWEIENKVANASLGIVEGRDPHATYHKMSYVDFKKSYPAINWDKVFEIYGLSEAKELNVSQPKAMKQVEEIIATTPLPKLKAYMEWSLLNSASSYLSDAMEAEHFDFFTRVMTGTEEMQPRWKRAQGVLNSFLGQAVGQLYVQKYFPPEAKARMEELVQNLMVAFGQRIDAQDWMSAETKAKAHEKLDSFGVKVGYPDKWKDYSGLTVDASKSLFENVVAANEFSYRDNIKRKFGKPVTHDEWGMTPQTVNASYSSAANQITFPAGILQYPFFDMNADDALNYGAIGVVIGHEMTHGFDNSGRQYDKDGNLIDWWTEEDAKLFDEHSKVLVDFFDKIEILPGLHANGELTLGENLSDHGGMMISYQAFKNATANKPLGKKDGFTADQRFFIAYAQVWCASMRDERMRSDTRSNEHSIGYWRVNGSLPHIDAWYDAFNITENDAMYIPKEERAVVW